MSGMFHKTQASIINQLRSIFLQFWHVSRSSSLCFIATKVKACTFHEKIVPGVAALRVAPTNAKPRREGQNQSVDKLKHFHTKSDWFPTVAFPTVIR